MPNFSTEASGNTSFTYWYGIPLVINPMEVSLYSARFTGKLLPSAAIASMRFSTYTCLPFAIAGIITNLLISLSYFLSGTSSRSSKITVPCEWDSLVVVLTITGVSYFSLIPNANFTKSFASWLSEGSRTGTCAALATHLVSCSFWEL